MKGKSSSTASLQSKPPVVVILGHVDHGKTTLLDYIRKSNVVAGEAGGITQSITTYRVKVPHEAGSTSGQKSKSKKVKSKEKTITFIDTPGHEAFTQMRNRGAKVADLAVLVVAANDGVMPQTKESIKYIKGTKIPFLVAINKTDLASASMEKIKGQLAENDVLVESFGGKIVSIPVSAKTGQGIAKLLEMILLLSEMEELKANPEGKFKGVIIESKLDPRKGPLATILIQNGTLRVNDQTTIENSQSKVKALFDEKGKRVKQAGPGVPVEILGLKKVPPVGASVTKPDEKKRSQKAPKTVFVPVETSVPSVIKKAPSKHSIPEGTEDTEKEKEKLKIILKTDTVGSQEAILDSFSDDVLVVHSGIGSINQSDIDLAKTTKAQVLAFNVKILASTRKLAKIEEVTIRQYKIIYELLEEIEKQVLKMLEPTIDEEIIGKAKIVAKFEIKGTKIAGAKVTEGKISKTEKIHLSRNKKIIGDAKITSMKHQKEDIIEAKTDTEFGAVFSPPLDFKIGDSIISYK